MIIGQRVKLRRGVHYSGIAWGCSGGHAWLGVPVGSQPACSIVAVALSAIRTSPEASRSKMSSVILPSLLLRSWGHRPFNHFDCLDSVFTVGVGSGLRGPFQATPGRQRA